MTNIPEHKLPISYFDVTDVNKQFISPTRNEKTKNPKKILKSTDVNQTADISTALSQRPKKKHNSKTSSNQVIDFREMDTDVILLVKVSSKSEELLYFVILT